MGKPDSEPKLENAGGGGGTHDAGGLLSVGDLDGGPRRRIEVLVAEQLRECPLTRLFGSLEYKPLVGDRCCAGIDDGRRFLALDVVTSRTADVVANTLRHPEAEPRVAALPLAGSTSRLDQSGTSQRPEGPLGALEHQRQVGILRRGLAVEVRRDLQERLEVGVAFLPLGQRRLVVILRNFSDVAGMVLMNLVEESHRCPSTLSFRVGTTQPHTTTRCERSLPNCEGLGPTRAADRVLEPVSELRTTRSDNGDEDEKPTQCGAGERQEEDRH